MQKNGFLLLLVISGLASLLLAAAENPVLSGKIVDQKGKPLKGAMVFLYDGPDTKKPASLISPQTDEAGQFKMTLPPGRYWAVARHRKAGGYGIGPLMSQDRFSGDPKAFEIDAGEQMSFVFKVLGIKEWASQRQLRRKDTIKLKGKIVDASGAPIENAYVIANKEKKTSGMPDYISPWTDKEGRFTLYFPHGTYYLGALKEFPPPRKYAIGKATVFKADKDNLSVVFEPVPEQKGK